MAQFQLGTEPTSRENHINWAREDGYAVAYLGYRGISDWEQELDHYQDKIGTGNIFNFYEMGGDECFLVVPRYRETEVALYPVDLDDNAEDMVGESLYTQRNGNPFVIFCNPSDLFSNVSVEISCAGDTASFSPQISLRDGHLEGLEGGQDVTEY